MKPMKRLIALLICTVLCIPFFPAVKAEEKVIFVRDGGLGSGWEASSPTNSLADAFGKLGSNGGTVVICGSYSLKETLKPAKHTGKVTITSVYGGVDYRTSARAKVTVTANFHLAGPTELKELNLVASVTSGATNLYPYRSIQMNGNELIIGEGISSTLANGCKTHISIVAGSGNQRLTVSSGDWQRVRGNDYTGSSRLHASVTLTVNGGTFHEKLMLAGQKTPYYCDVEANINGGTFLGGIYLCVFTKDSDTYNGNASVTVNGGTVYGDIGVASRRIGKFNGSYTLKINGGSLEHITYLDGAKHLAGNMTSTLEYGEGVDANAPFTGTLTFQNALRDGADPFAFYHNGLYYLTSTGGTSIGLACAANLSDIGEAAKTTIFTCPDGYENAWSPEIHHFTDEEIGAGNGGWYLFLGLANMNDPNAGDTSASKQREYVLKCLDGDYLLGRWGHPVTGEVNKPLLVSFEGDTDYNSIFCAGMSILRIDGKVYMTFVSEVGRGTSGFHQTINITAIKNPWTITGEPVVICKPDYDWEAHGYTTNGKGKWWPKVVEGCSAVYGDDGSVYLMYTGSGYWTTWYALGYMKYTGGDPLNASSWKKNPKPILQRESSLNANSVNGCGHGSYFTDAEGNMWVCYHGYIGKNTDSGRFAFLERIYVNNERVYIGNDTGHPAPLSTVYTVNVNPTPISGKVNGFDTVKDSSAVTTEPPVTTTEAPVTTTEPPVTTTEAPVTTTEAPVTTTEAPVTTTEAPVTTTEPPVTTTEAPVTTTEAPVTTTEAPVTTTEPPVTTTEAPVTTTEAPVTTTEPPVTTTEAPGTSEAVTTERTPESDPPAEDLQQGKPVNYTVLAGVAIAIAALLAAFVVISKKRK